MLIPGLSLIYEGLDLSSRASRKRHCKKALTQRHMRALNKENKVSLSLLAVDAFLL